VQEGSGLRVRRGHRLIHSTSNYWLDGMVYVIERESYAAESAYFVVTGGQISGNVYPGVDYKVVVSGPRFADNDQMVRALTTNEFFEPNLPGVMRGLSQGTFFNEPYAVTAAVFGAADISDVAPEAPPAVATVNALPPLFVSDTTLIFRPNLTATHNVGYVSVGAFRDLLQSVYGDAAFAEWDAASATATVTSPNRAGGVTTVVLVVGSTTITVDGVVSDIATLVGGASGPIGTVAVIHENNLNFLPLRALSQAFGWVPVVQGNAIIFQ